jgi:hypothetical protein
MAGDGPPLQPVHLDHRVARSPSSGRRTGSPRRPGLKESSRRPVDQPSGAGDRPVGKSSVDRGRKTLPKRLMLLAGCSSSVQPARKVPLSYVRFPTPNCRTARVMKVRGSSIKLCKVGRIM